MQGLPVVREFNVFLNFITFTTFNIIKNGFVRKNNTEPTQHCIATAT